jgi:hypothetical protein
MNMLNEPIINYPLLPTLSVIIPKNGVTLALIIYIIETIFPDVYLS